MSIPDEFSLSVALEEENTKLYRCQAALLRFGGEYKYASVYVTDPIPVLSGDRQIGTVVSTMTVDDLLVGELVIDYKTPERFDIESGTKLYVAFNAEARGAGTAPSLHPISVSLVKENTDLPPVGDVLL